MSVKLENYSYDDEYEILLTLEDLVEINSGGYLDQAIANKCKMYLNGRIIQIRKQEEN